MNPLFALDGSIFCNKFLPFLSHGGKSIFIFGMKLDRLAMGKARVVSHP
jgi:hypothetical protein